MRGSSPIRSQGYDDPLLVEVMKAHGYKELPLYKARPPEDVAIRARWKELGKVRDGEVNAKRHRFASPELAAHEIKAFARNLGADDVGIARLKPIMIRDGLDLPHDTAICMIFGENYQAALKGARAVEAEAARAYTQCAENANKLAEYIRSLGYPALAHHNGGSDVQAIAVMYEAGLGELGKHGSLIHPELGASHRPGIVTTTLPLVADEPLIFGVQDRCLNCNLCTNNCPADAIPADDYVKTEGVRRWLTDVSKCYIYSRLREQYCHICVDVCPYVHQANKDATKKDLYKSYMMKRKRVGYKTPTWWIEDEEDLLNSQE